MNSSKYKPVSEFRLEGQFLGFVIDEDGKLKYVRVEVENSELRVKLSKESRTTLVRGLQLGDRIQVFGKKKLNLHTGQLKLKAYQVNKLSLDSQETIPAQQVSHAKPKAKILVCQKSGCLKRGGKGLCKALEVALCDRNLQDHVKIERTGCLKHCSKAPNMILMPGKTRISGMHPDAIATLLDNLSSI